MSECRELLQSCHCGRPPGPPLPLLGPRSNASSSYSWRHDLLHKHAYNGLDCSGSLRTASGPDVCIVRPCVSTSLVGHECPPPKHWPTAPHSSLLREILPAMYQSIRSSTQSHSVSVQAPGTGHSPQHHCRPITSQSRRQFQGRTAMRSDHCNLIWSFRVPCPSVVLTPLGATPH